MRGSVQLPLAFAAFLALTAASACRPETGPAPAEPAPAPAAETPAEPTPADSTPGPIDPDTASATFEGTAGVTTKPPSAAVIAVLANVRTAEHGAFDRVVFEFQGAALPGYHVEYVDRPVRACGSGDVVPLRGDGWLEVRFTPAQAHTDDGEATVQDRNRRLSHPNLLDLKSTCDFEGVVTWVLGLNAPNRYRVLELQNPTRLAVDVRH